MRNRATVVVIRDKKVLLVRDRGSKCFSLPGGGIRKREPTLGAAIRELYEETNLWAIKATRLRDCDYKGSKNKHKVCLIEAEGDVKLQKSEISDFLWWELNKPLTVPVYPHVQYILSKV